MDNTSFVYDGIYAEKRINTAFGIQKNAEYDPQIYQSCSTVFHGIAFVFGGVFASREVFDSD